MHRVFRAQLLATIAADAFAVVDSDPPIRQCHGLGRTMLGATPATDAAVQNLRPISQMTPGPMSDPAGHTIFQRSHTARRHELMPDFTTVTNEINF